MSSFYDSLNEFSYASTERGRNYFNDGRVSIVDFSNYECISEIKGSGKNVYKAKLKFNKKYQLISNSCSCPVGYYCKHVAATLFALDSMADDNLLEMNEERLEGPKSDWRVELDKIFVKYFSSRYRFVPNYGALNAFLLNNEELFIKEKIDALTYITKRLFEYYTTYYYDFSAIEAFLKKIYERYLSKEEYIELLEKIKKDDKKRFFTIFGGLFHIEEYKDDNNQYLASLISSNEVRELAEGISEVLTVNNIDTSNLMYLFRNHPKLFVYYNLREAFNSLERQKIDNEEDALRLGAYVIGIINIGAPAHLEEKELEIIREYNPSLEKEIAYLLFMQYKCAERFVSLIKAYENETIPEEYMEKIKKIKKDFFFLRIFFHEPVSFDNEDLAEINHLLDIPHFFDGYESYVIKVVLARINHAKKLKNFDEDIIFGLRILDRLCYEEIVPLLVDKIIVKKMIDDQYHHYFFLLYKYKLLETIGYKRYAVFNE